MEPKPVETFTFIVVSVVVYLALNFTTPLHAVIKIVLSGGVLFLLCSMFNYLNHGRFLPFFKCPPQTTDQSNSPE